MTYRYIYVYGSLRAGEYNFNSFKNIFKDEIKVIKKNFPIKGFKLYSLGSYPGIKIAEDNHSIICDVLKVSERCFRAIDKMELSSNYYRLGINEASIYIYKGNVEEDKFIKDGDWKSR